MFLLEKSVLNKTFEFEDDFVEVTLVVRRVFDNVTINSRIQNKIKNNHYPGLSRTVELYINPIKSSAGLSKLVRLSL
jgi:hypothetical protein